jgi:hypothetical protein
MLTNAAAEHMHNQGGFYTAAKRAGETNISAKEAIGLLYNIRQGNKYQNNVTDLPGREVKIIAINGNKQSKANLWYLSMFGAA